jgi:hypothetical protein
MSRNWHVEDYKPDTYIRLQPAENILSRIYRYFSRIADQDGSSLISCQRSRRSSHIGSFTKCKQAAKPIWTLNTTINQLRDSTASILFFDRILRKRSFHSSSLFCLDRKTTKGNIIGNSNLEAIDTNKINPVKSVKPIKVAKQVGVTTMVMARLEQMKYTDQKFYKLMEIVADPYFLVKCYVEIYHKKGNFTLGSDKFSIDGIN